MEDYWTFVTDQLDDFVLPAWFVEKWSDSVHFNTGDLGAGLPISSKQVGRDFDDVARDLQRAIQEAVNQGAYESTLTDLGMPEAIILWLGELEGVTHTEIHLDRIIHDKPASWKPSELAQDLRALRLNGVPRGSREIGT